MLRCRNCGTSWLYRYHEDIDWDGNGDVQLSWHVKLTDAEADLLTRTPDHYREDLSFLLDRDRFADWDGTVYRVAPPNPDRADQAWYPPRTGDRGAVIVLPAAT